MYNPFECIKPVQIQNQSEYKTRSNVKPVRIQNPFEYKTCSNVKPVRVQLNNARCIANSEKLSHLAGILMTHACRCERMCAKLDQVNDNSVMEIAKFKRTY